MAAERSSAERLAALRGGGRGRASPGGEVRPEDTAPLPVAVERPRRWEWIRAWRAGSAWRKVRLDPGRRPALILASVAGLAAVISAIGVLRGQPVVQEPPPLVGYSETGGTTGSSPGAQGLSMPVPSSTARTGPLVLSVVGKVRHPGLVSVPEGSRVADAIAKAGGALRGADLTAVNLARKVTDGEQIAVGVPGAALPPSAGSAASAAPTGAHGAANAPLSPGGPLDLNQATLAQLDALPGIGPVTAQRILAWRTEHGQFRSVGQLREVQGIGDRRLGQLKSLVTVIGGSAR